MQHILCNTDEQSHFQWCIYNTSSKGVDVGTLLDDLVGWLSRTMTSSHLNACKQWVTLLAARATKHVLQLCYHFERVEGHHSVVMIPCAQQPHNLA